MKKSLQKGFTLMELLIVMVILGILTTIVASSFSSSQEKARDTRRKSDLQSIAKAIEVYYNDKGEYPESNTGNLDGYAWGYEFVDENDTIYMTKLPEEKTAARNYYYYTEGGQNQTYAIFTRLENEIDTGIPYDSIDEIYQYYNGSDCGVGAGCNYVINSSNFDPETIYPLADEQ